MHDRRRQYVFLEQIALAMKVHVAKGLLWPSIHILEVESKRFLDFLSKMMSAEPVFENYSVAVYDKALLFTMRQNRGCS